MEFFNSLPLDLKMLVVGIAGFTLLALFTGNRKAEKRYTIVLAVLAAAGVYRFTHLPGDGGPQRASVTRVGPPAVAAPPKHKPLESTSAR